MARCAVLEIASRIGDCHVARFVPLAGRSWPSLSLLTRSTQFLAPISRIGQKRIVVRHVSEKEADTFQPSSFACPNATLQVLISPEFVRHGCLERHLVRHKCWNVSCCGICANPNRERGRALLSSSAVISTQAVDSTRHNSWFAKRVPRGIGACWSGKEGTRRISAFGKAVPRGIGICCSGEEAAAMDSSSADTPMESVSVTEEKKIVRRIIRKELRATSVESRKKEDMAVTKHVIDSELFKKSKVIGAYLSCPSLREVDTMAMVSHILERQKTLYVPHIEDEKHQMKLLRIDNVDDDVVPNSMKVLEPKVAMADGSLRDDLMDADQPLDLLLVPGLAFDGYGGRLGRGGGYYDWFMSKYKDHVKSKGWKVPPIVALSYTVQMRSTPLPMGACDQYVDAIVTKDGILWTSKRQDP